MKKRLALLLMVPLTLVSCSRKGVSFDALKARVDTIVDDNTNPYYRAIGSIDINGAVHTISEEDGTFDKMPTGTSYVAHARYNKGYYTEFAYDGIRYEDPGSIEDIMILPTSSMSYYLRAPLRLHKDNFFGVLEDGSINPSCGYFMLNKIINIWSKAIGSINASGNQPYYELLPDGGFAIGGDVIRTKVYIDNIPYYPDPATTVITPEDIEEDPFPCYKTEIDGRFNIRFEYNAQGWLTREFLATSDYDYSKTIGWQVALETIYVYNFGS